MVATGICGARAWTRALSIFGGPTSWNPAGTVCKILIGYFPEAVLWARQYSQAAMVNTITTKAFLATEMKKKTRPIQIPLNTVAQGTQHVLSLLLLGYRLDNWSQMMRTA
jgi:hypothetical protein